MQDMPPKSPGARPAAGDPQEPTPTRPVLKYQPGFDGLRFFGILSVLAAHVSTVQPGLTRFGCYMFVDMFFVISGYLITTLLLRERQGRGRVSLKAFYVRRFARLYPLIAAILVVAVVQRVFWADAPASPSWLGVAGIGFYFSNFAQLINHNDALSSWGPLWSLSIEEQFYALWPITLLVVIGRSYRLRRALLLVVVLTIAMWVGRAYAWYSTPQFPHDPNRQFVALTNVWHTFYYSTWHRPDGLLVGCAIGLVLAEPESRLAHGLIRAARLLRIPVILGILILVAATASTHAGWQVYYGLALFNLCVGLLMVDLLARPTSRIAGFFGFRPFAWVGRRTYFIYAVHLAVFVLAFDVLGLTTLPEIFATTVAGLCRSRNLLPVLRGSDPSMGLPDVELDPEGRSNHRGPDRHRPALNRPGAAHPVGPPVVTQSRRCAARCCVAQRCSSEVEIAHSSKRSPPRPTPWS